MNTQQRIDYHNLEGKLYSCQHNNVTESLVADNSIGLETIELCADCGKDMMLVTKLETLKETKRLAEPEETNL